jgi:murein DD-endopeptidase MepM/ murein hydrolase activator NlpD
VAVVKLVGVKAEVDPIRKAVRSAAVSVEIDGRPVTIASGNYELPVTVGGVQVDCPVVGDYRANTTVDHWGLDKAARLRLWPAGAPWIDPETFTLPARQKWFASLTQMANEPVYTDGGDDPGRTKIYYHAGLDIGGPEGLVEVVAATDGLVVSSGNDQLPGYVDSPVQVRYDVVYLLDDRGWYYRYSHMESIDPAVRPGAKLTKGQRIGVLGKEGGSGGWSHLHFEAKSRQPSGKWGTQEGYAFLWQTALREQKPDVVAVARPHSFARTGDTVVLDGRKSWSRSGQPSRYEWTFGDGTTSDKPVVEKVYKTPGTFSEVLKVTDAAGHSAYDFASVQVLDPERPDELPPTIHAAYAPTEGLKPGDPLTFKARTFRVGRDGGEETWDFGDGTPAVTTRSDGNAVQHAADGYGVTTHAYAKPGDYLVRVRRSNRRGQEATARLHVRVGANVP